MNPYLRDPAAIYRRSFELIRQDADFGGIPLACQDIAVRIVHACGMPEVANNLRFSRNFKSVALGAIADRRPIFVDAEMVRHGIIDKTLNVVCTLNDPRTREIAGSNAVTRSAAAVELWRPQLDGSIVVIGNAPTALFAILEIIDAGAPRPAAIIAFPVGFVGAAESKDEVIANPRGLEFATLLGRCGGSAMAAAVVNALTQGVE